MLGPIQLPKTSIPESNEFGEGGSQRTRFCFAKPRELSSSNKKHRICIRILTYKVIIAAVVPKSAFMIIDNRKAISQYFIPSFQYESQNRDAKKVTKSESRE